MNKSMLEMFIVKFGMYKKNIKKRINTLFLGDKILLKTIY